MLHFTHELSLMDVLKGMANGCIYLTKLGEKKQVWEKAWQAEGIVQFPRSIYRCVFGKIAVCYVLGIYDGNVTLPVWSCF